MDKEKESSVQKSEQSSNESRESKYTGALPKKKIFPLKSSENESSSSSSSNLLKMKNKIGKSAPNLAVRSNRDVIDPSTVVRRTHQALRSPAVHRISFNCPHQLSPRSESPMGQRSPIDSPRINSPSANHFQFMPFKRLSTNKFQENRRWSIVSVSLPSSSGYASTSGSNISSQASSQERLHQFPNAPTNEELRLLNNRFSNEPNRMSHQAIQKQQSHPLSQNTTSMSSLILQQQQIQQQQQHQLSHRKSFHGSQNAQHSKNYPSSSTPPLNSSNDSSNEGSFHCERPQRSLVFRPRSRSLSSPSRSPVTDNHVTSMNQLFKERFPKAQIQMDERLTSFINEYKSISTSNRDSQPIVRFVTTQILEIARDCLHKSHSKQILTSRYFCDMSENLQRLLIETNEKSPEAAGEVARIIKKLILIISRPARLLECLEFDPEEFYKLLEAAEDQAKTNHITNDLPIYIITKLGLNRDPLSDINPRNSCEDEKDKQNANNIDNSNKTNSESLSSSKTNNEKCDTSDTSSSKDAGRKMDENENPNSSIVSISSDTSCLTSTPIKTSQHQLTTESTDRMAGPSENDYEFIKLISNGAYGSVHLVKHKQNRQRYALKKINKNNLMLRNQVEQVFLERDILSFTDNPFVVTMFGSFETKKHLCLVMEYVEGGDCASLLKNIGPLPSDMARLYFAEMVLAVEYLHSFGIVHRDLKPDNMLITALGHIKLTDFGLSKMGLMSRTTQLYEGYVDTNNEARQFSDKQIFGTPEYIAPEVILRQGYGKTIDYWSMGIILYEFLVGCVPFFGETPEELFAHVVNDAIIEFPSDDEWALDPLAKDLILLLLVLHPDDRLGYNGPEGVKQHPYLVDLDWSSLLRYKAEFIPRLENDEDTSYFDTRVDRYNHEFEDTDTDDSPILSSNFTSYSPQYRKQCHSRQVYYGSDSSNSSINDSGKMTPDFRTLNINPSSIKMPSTPVDSPFEFPGDLNSQERQMPSYFLRHQHIKHVLSTAEVLENQTQKLQKPLKNLHISTPDTSQTDHSSDDVSPKIQRRRKNLIAAAAEDGNSKRHMLPKLSISLEQDSVPSPRASTSRESSNVSSNIEKDGKLLKSASAVDLSLKIRPSYSDSDRTSLDLIRKSKLKFESNISEMKLKQHMGSDLDLDNSSSAKPFSTSGGNGSSASSREVSPSRPDGPLIHTIKPPILLKRGKRGFGFTIHTIRVYYGDTDYYTMHHTVMAVDENSPATQSGLQPGDLITHINGEPVQGLYHTQVLQLLLSSQEHVTIRATPLNQTSIQIGGRKREPGVSKMAKKINPRPKKQRNSSDKKRRASLFRRISSKIANAELFQQQISSASALSPIAPSRSFQSFAARSQAERSNGNARLSLSPLDPFYQQINISSGSQSSSPPSSVPNTPTSNLNAAPVFHQRPSSLHGLKHGLKLHSIGGSVKSPSTSRRKSVCMIPLSPLARTPSPSPISTAIQVKNVASPISPTRSPSPLALALQVNHHQPGSSQLTQSYTPNQSNSSSTSKHGSQGSTSGSKLQKSSSFKSNEKDGK